MFRDLQRTQQCWRRRRVTLAERARHSAGAWWSRANGALCQWRIPSNFRTSTTTVVNLMGLSIMSEMHMSIKATIEDDCHRMAACPRAPLKRRTKMTAVGGGGASAAAAAAKKSKKKAPRKAVHIAAPKMKSRRKARQVTTDFHRLTHELDEVKKDKSLDTEQRNLRIKELSQKIDAIGGRSAYQDASILSTSFHKTSKWVFQLLTRFERRPKSKEPPLRVLEVGAINTQLLSCPWLNVRAIDLNSKHERIEQCDFFSLKPSGEYQVVVSSMVINCVPDAVARGNMLKMTYEHLQPSGLFFLMLPLLCLRNSKYMSYRRFVEILEAVGFHVKDKKDSPKVSFFCLEKTTDKKPSNKKFPHTVIVDGPKRNDFSVVL